MQVPEMGDLLTHVKAAAQWYTLGIHMVLKQSKLEVVRKDKSNDSEAALMKVFRVWLDSVQDPSWNVIVIFGFILMTAMRLCVHFCLI